MSDENFARIRILCGDVGVAGECNPITVRGEAGALRIIAGGDLLQVTAIGFHQKDFVLERPALIERDPIFDRPIAAPARVNGVIDDFGRAIFEIHDVEFVAVILAHCEQNLRPVR